MEINEEVVFQLIAYSGEARSDIFEAFQLCKNKEYAKAQAALEAAKEKMLKAHNVQTNLIQQEAGGNYIEVRLLMVHAQDHLMTCMLAKDIMTSMIEMQKEIFEIKEHINM